MCRPPTIIALGAIAAAVLAGCGNSSAERAAAPVAPDGTLASPAAAASSASGTEGFALPTSDHHHALAQLPDGGLLLGIHGGAYAAHGPTGPWTKVTDGDAMNIAVAGDGAIWIGGHDVLLVRDGSGDAWRQPAAADLPGLDVHGLAVDPTEPERVVVAIAAEGVYESFDRGSTFRRIGRVAPSHIYGLLITDDGRLWAADLEAGLLRSDDGGRNWRVVLDRPVAQIAADPSVPGRMLAIGERALRSDDGGATWQELDGPAGALAVPPSAEVGAPLLMVTPGGIVASSDGGTTWRSA